MCFSLNRRGHRSAGFLRSARVKWEAEQTDRLCWPGPGYLGETSLFGNAHWNLPAWYSSDSLLSLKRSLRRKRTSAPKPRPGLPPPESTFFQVQLPQWPLHHLAGSKSFFFFPFIVLGMLKKQTKNIHDLDGNRNQKAVSVHIQITPLRGSLNLYEENIFQGLVRTEHKSKAQMS